MRCIRNSVYIYDCNHIKIQIHKIEKRNDDQTCHCVAVNNLNTLYYYIVISLSISPFQIIGTYSKSKVIDIFLFLSGQLYVNVATKDHSVSEIRGRVIGLPYSKDIDRSGMLHIPNCIFNSTALCPDFIIFILQWFSYLNKIYHRPRL